MVTRFVSERNLGLRENVNLDSALVAAKNASLRFPAVFLLGRRSEIVLRMVTFRELLNNLS